MTHRTQPAGDAVVVGNIIAALALIVLAALLGGCFFDGLGPTYKSTCNTSACFTTPHTTPSGSLYMLRGDTVRFVACDNYNTVCVPGSDTGNVLASWSVPDSTVVAISHPTPAIRIPSATTVLVRGVAPGHVTMTAAFSSPAWTQQVVVHVADSSAITAIQLPVDFVAILPFTDTLRVGRQVSFLAILSDVAGNWYSVVPTALAVNDTTMLKATMQKTAGQQFARVTVTALQAGKASIQASFLGVTATRQLTVVP